MAKLPRCKGKLANDQPCEYNAWRDGFCKVHHPSRVDGIPGVTHQDVPIETRPVRVKVRDGENRPCPVCTCKTAKAQGGYFQCDNCNQMFGAK